MTRLSVLFLVACATTRSSQVPVEPVEPAQPVDVTPAVHAPALDEPAVKERTHAWLDTFDRFDPQGFAEPLGASFVWFKDSRFIDKALVTESLQRRKDRHLPIATRTWGEERVFVAENVAIFVGLATEHIPAFETSKAHDQESWNTVVWARESGRWVVAQWQWQGQRQRAGVDAEKNRWNEIYRNTRGFHRKPNQLLVDTIKGKQPGTAIDIAMGQGRNALYLAAQGWKTTGVDISDEGINQAKAEAATQKLALDAVLADIDTYDFGTAKWDLITMIYAGADAKLVARIKPSLKSGGLFISEYFHAESDVAKTGPGGWATGELAALFKDGFKILRDDVVEDNADWAHQRKTKLVRFVAQKL